MSYPHPFSDIVCKRAAAHPSAVDHQKSDYAPESEFSVTGVAMHVEDVVGWLVEGEIVVEGFEVILCGRW